MTTATPAPLNVGQAIATVMGRLGPIPKTESANGVPYKFRGIEAMTAALQPLLAEVGLVILPQAKSVVIDPSPGSKEAWQDVMITFDWLIVGPDGSTLTATTIGIGRDHTDKGANKAQTQAFKYLLMHMFCVSDPKDDGDSHDYNDSQTQSPQRRPDVDATLDRMRALDEHQKAELRQWADECGTSLTAAQIAADADWREMIDAKVKLMTSPSDTMTLLSEMGDIIDIDDAAEVAPTAEVDK